MPDTPFSSIEREIIVLDAVGTAVDAMVNRGLFQFLGSRDELELRFHSQPHEQLFSVLLADFLEKVSAKIVGTSSTPTSLLLAICASPHFEVDGSVTALKDAVDRWHAWLSTEIQVPIWLPSFDRTIDVALAREELHRILGTISKHNFGRLTATAGELSGILAKMGEGIPPLEVLRALDEFYDKFRSDVLGHHTMPLAEMLNEIRWGIHEYLKPEFARSYTPVIGSIAYDYRMPADVESPLAQSSYWNVMNDVRRQPLVERFECRSLKALRPRY